MPPQYCVLCPWLYDLLILFVVVVEGRVQRTSPVQLNKHFGMVLRHCLWQTATYTLPYTQTEIATIHEVLDVSSNEALQNLSTLISTGNWTSIFRRLRTIH
jgi:hypothetical protein